MAPAIDAWRRRVDGRPPLWLTWTRRLQGIAATGLVYASDPYDAARYEEVRALASEVAASYGSADAGALAPLLTAGAGHPTPKVEVRGALFEADRVLLVRERDDGGWALPGGWADVGEPPSRAVEREMAEESGRRVRAAKLFAVHDRDRHNFPPHVHSIWKLHFLCEALDAGTARPGHDVDAVGFFAADALPGLSTGRTTEKQIAKAFAHHADPMVLTEFD
jgi:ADP-ribose pyrophosphatase YjhB (NUDIX family)